MVLIRIENDSHAAPSRLALAARRGARAGRAAAGRRAATAPTARPAPGGDRRSTRCSTSPSGSPGDHADVTNLTQPGAGAARPRADRPADRAGRRRRRAWSTRRASRPPSTTRVDQNAPGPRRRRRPRPAGPRPATDPHFWLDPTRLAEVAGRRRAVSSRDADPAHAADYAATSTASSGDLAAPRPRTSATGLADCRTRTRSWSATTRSATSAGATASTCRRSTASPPTPSRPPPTSGGCRT